MRKNKAEARHGTGFSEARLIDDRTDMCCPIRTHLLIYWASGGMPCQATNLSHVPALIHNLVPGLRGQPVPEGSTFSSIIGYHMDWTGTFDVFCVTVAGHLPENIGMATAGTRVCLISFCLGNPVTSANITTISTTLPSPAAIMP